jgi:uncharacterized protein YacL
MGFGTLLCGYFVIFLMSFGMGQYAFAALLVGGFVSYSATMNLKDYCPSFIYTTVCAALEVLLGVWGGIVFLSDLFMWDAPFITETVTSAVYYVDFLVGLAFHVTMLYSITELAEELGLDKIRGRARGSMFFMIICGIFQLLIGIIPALQTVPNQMPTKILILCMLFAYIFNSVLVYTCYIHICPKGEEMGRERKPSRFKLINEIREKADAKEEKAIRESIDYIEGRMQKRNSKKQQKKKRH